VTEQPVAVETSASVLPRPLSALQFRRLRWQVFGVIFVAYVGYYFGRVTLPVSLPLLQEAFGFSATQVGFILSAYFGTYALAKAVNGFLGDRLGGKTVLLFGLAGPITCNLVFGFGRELTFFAVVWALNAYFQSMGWLGLLPVMSRWYAPPETGRALALMSLSYQIGDLVARTVAAGFLLFLVWHQLFWAHAAICAAVAVFVLLNLKPAPPAEHARAHTTGQVTGHSAGLRHERSHWERGAYALRTVHMLRSVHFWTVCAVYLGLSMVRYIFWGWSVDYLVRNGASIGPAVVSSAVFPLAGSAGTLFAGWLSDRMQARRGPVVVGMNVLLVLSLVLFTLVPPDRLLLVVAVLGMVGFALYGPYSLMAGAIAIDFGSKQSAATAAGIIDSIGAVGVILTGVGMGVLIDRYGWASALPVVVAIAALAAIGSLALWRMKAESGSEV
jgi:sugar phosphate permease